MSCSMFDDIYSRLSWAVHSEIRFIAKEKIDLTWNTTNLFAVDAVSVGLISIFLCD